MRQEQTRTARLIDAFVKDDNGATAIEYALIASATGLALAAVLPTVQSRLGTVYDQILGYFAAI